jgi:hypothetical protein
LEAGRHLLEIRQKRLWRGQYDGYEEYVEARFHVSHRMCNYYLHYAENEKVFKAHGLPAPPNERVNRLLDPIRENVPKLVRVWKALTNKTSKPTYSDIQERVQIAAAAEGNHGSPASTSSTPRQTASRITRVAPKTVREKASTSDAPSFPGKHILATVSVQHLSAADAISKKFAPAARTHVRAGTYDVSLGVDKLAELGWLLTSFDKHEWPEMTIEIERQ